MKRRELTDSLQVGVWLPKLSTKLVISANKAAHHSLIVTKQQKGLTACS